MPGDGGYTASQTGTLASRARDWLFESEVEDPWHVTTSQEECHVGDTKPGEVTNRAGTYTACASQSGSAPSWSSPSGAGGGSTTPVRLVLAVGAPVLAATTSAQLVARVPRGSRRGGRLPVEAAVFGDAAGALVSPEYSRLAVGFGGRVLKTLLVHLRGQECTPGRPPPVSSDEVGTTRG